MPNYTVTAVVKIEMTGTFAVTAKDEDAAQKKADAIAEKVVAACTVAPVKGVEIDWEETDQACEVEEVNEE